MEDRKRQQDSLQTPLLSAAATALASQPSDSVGLPSGSLVVDRRGSLQSSPPLSSTSGDVRLDNMDDIVEDWGPELTLSHIQHIDATRWRNWLRWATIDFLLERCCHYFAVGWAALPPEPLGTKYICSDRVWLSGRGIPIQNGVTLGKIFAIRSFLQGIEEIAFTALHSLIYGLLGYQFYLLGTTGKFNVIELFDSLTNSSSSGLLNIVQGLARVPSIYLKLVLASPFIWGVVRGLMSLPQGTVLSSVELHKKIVSAKPKWGNGFFSSEVLQWLPVVSARSDLQGLGKVVRWDGRISDADRQAVFEHIEKTAKTGHKGMQRAAMQILGKIAHSFHGDDLKRLKKHGYTDEQLTALRALKVKSILALESLSDYSIEPHTALSLVAGNTCSVWWQNTYTTLANKILNGTSQAKQYLHQMTRVVYAKYLLWWLGMPISWRSGILFWLYKTGKLALDIVFFKTLVNLIQDAINCPKQPGFRFGQGFAPWAGDYGEKCFVERLRLFRSINQQESMDELIKELSNYHLPTLTKLDISGKELNPEAFIKLVKALKTQGANIRILIARSGFNATTLSSELFSELNDLVEADLHFNKFISVMDYAFSGLKNIKRIFLNDNQISFLSDRAFTGLFELEYLDLSGNLIAKIDPKTFRGLYGLTYLNLGDNLITSLTKEMTLDLKRLVEIYLQNNYLPCNGFTGVLELNTLEKLVLADNKINTTIFFENSKLYYLRHLDLTSNIIQHVEPSHYANMLSLESLEFSSNNIAGIKSTTTPSLENLHNLGLSFNYLVSLNMSNFAWAPNLKNLDLSYNSIQFIKENTLYGTPHLLWLDLAYNKLPVFPSYVFQYTPSLMTLNISFNAISDFKEKDLQWLPKLEVLVMPTFSVFSAEKHIFLNSSNLKSLTVGSTAGFNVSKNIFAQHKNLTDLTLFGCPAELQDVLYGITQLKRLTINGCSLFTLPKDMFSNMSQLQYLDLGGNEITTLADNTFINLKNLKYLNLASNALYNIPSQALRPLAHLEYLNLALNQIDFIPANEFSSLKNLRELIMDQNPIGGLASRAFYNLPYLEMINLYHCEISFIPENAFINLPHLKSVVLTDNYITSISDNAFVNLPKLETMDIWTNFLSEQVQEISRTAFVNVKLEGSLTLESNMITNQAFYNLTFCLPHGLTGLNIRGINITQKSLLKISALLPCTNITQITLPAHTQRNVDLITEIQLKILQRFCESKRCQGVWPKTQGKCALPLPPQPQFYADTAVKTFHTSSSEPPCFYRGGGTNLVAGDGQPNIGGALLPECQITPINYWQRLSQSILGAGLIAGVMEMLQESLKIYYPKNQIAQGIRAALFIVPVLALAYLEQSHKAYMVSIAGMIMFAGLKVVGVNERAAYASMLTTVIMFNLYWLAPSTLFEASGFLMLTGASMVVDSASRFVARKTVQWSAQFFKSEAIPGSQTRSAPRGRMENGKF